MKDRWTFIWKPTTLPMHNTNFRVSKWLVFAKVHYVRYANRWVMKGWV